MRVDRGFDFLVCCLERDREPELRDYLGRFRSDNVCPDDLAVRFTNEKLHEAFAFADGAGLAARHEGELPNLELEALFLRRTFRQPDAGDLWVAVGAARERGDLLRLMPRFEHAFDGLDRFEAGNVREPRWSDDVSGAVD